MTSKQIAALIINTPVSERGNLFFEVAEELRKQSQVYTAQLFYKIAFKYELNKKINTKKRN